MMSLATAELSAGLRSVSVFRSFVLEELVSALLVSGLATESLLFIAELTRKIPNAKINPINKPKKIANSTSLRMMFY